jgi:hypothetical protein
MRRFPLSPRGTSGERAGERGFENERTCLLSPPLSSTKLVEERENKVAQENEITCSDVFREIEF